MKLTTGVSLLFVILLLSYSAAKGLWSDLFRAEVQEVNDIASRIEISSEQTIVGQMDWREASSGFAPILTLIRADGVNFDSDRDGLRNLLKETEGNNIIDSGETDPDNSESDGDGMPDGWKAKFGLNPAVLDAEDDLDIDGVSNSQEDNLRFLPDDIASQPTVFQFYYDDNGNLEQMQRP